MIVFRYRGKTVAIKRYKHNQRRLTISDMFCREISMLAIVQHPNVIKFMGACVQEGHFAILTEFIESGSLHGIIHVQMRTLDLPTNVNIAYPIFGILGTLCSQFFGRVFF